MAKTGVGSVIGRRTVSKGREYRRVWIYIPTKISEDSAFPFAPGDPCFVQLDPQKKLVTVKRIDKQDAVNIGWRLRDRRNK